MTRTLVAPGPTVRQLSGHLPEDDGYSLSVIAKRTYQLDERGRFVPSPAQIPLQEAIAYEGESDELVGADSDLVPWKPLTDVVVRGCGQSRDPVEELGLAVRIGSVRKDVLALGERRAALSATGRLVYSRPEPFTRLPLSFAWSYGGRDRLAEAKHGIPAERFRPLLPPTTDVASLSPYLYPRNPAGRGFLIEATRSALEALALPRLEDPDDRLTPERLVVGDPTRWPVMPVPQSFGWLGHTWFPRCALFGALPPYGGPAGQFREAKMGWIPSDLTASGPPHRRFRMQAANGASLGLQVPHLRGDEEGTLHNLSPGDPVLSFRLPGDRPRIWTDGRKGKLNETEPVMHTAVIEPNERRLTVTWRGHARALRPYTQEELATMPLRVEWSR